MIQDICTLLEDKKILILGYGREGQSTYRFIRRCYPDKVVAIYDKKEITDPLQHVVLHHGETFDDLLLEYDFIIKSPGIVLRHEDEETLSKITSQTDIFLRFYREQTIGITGTKGKSTTSSLLYHVLKCAGKDVKLVGNIGIPVFDELDHINEDTLVVYELSSHQLEYAKHSPHIGMLLNIFEEHLDHYGTFERYVAAKEKLYKNQQKGDLFLYNRKYTQPVGLLAEPITLSGDAEDANLYVKGNQIFFRGNRIVIPSDEILLKGQHNLNNIGAAYCIAKLLQVSDETFEDAIKTFKPLPHRLEYVGEFNGITFYNDSISTICETTIQAAKSIPNVDTVILGGMDRGISYEPLVDFLLESEIRNIILMPDTGYRIHDMVSDRNGPKTGQQYFRVANVAEAVALAKRETMQGKVCLFSPAAASYGFFKNFEERGEVFKSCVLSNS